MEAIEWNDVIQDTVESLSKSRGFVVIYVDDKNTVQANVFHGVNKGIIDGLGHMRDFLKQQLDLQRGTIRWLVADIFNCCG